MRKSFRKKFKPLLTNKIFRANERITAPQLVVIDENGKGLGVLSKEEALLEARKRETDLVEVSPLSNPPVAKLMDYGSFKYQKEKEERKQKAKSKTVELKTIKISPRIGAHDTEIRVGQAVKFLDGGDKVKIEMQLRGRENRHTDLARQAVQEMIDAVRAKLKESSKELRLEQEIEAQGNRISAIFFV